MIIKQLVSIRMVLDVAEYHAMSIIMPKQRNVYMLHFQTGLSML